MCQIYYDEPAFQPKIDNQFKMCSLDDVDDLKNRVLAQMSCL